MKLNITKVNYMLDSPFGSGGVERMQPRNQQNPFWHPGVVISNTLASVWIAYRGCAVKCARSQVRPFHEDDEAAHEHVTEHMRKLGERQLQDGDFPYEDITGQDEPPVDSLTVTRPAGPSGDEPMRVEPCARRRMGGKHKLSVRTNQQHRLPMLPQTLHDKRQWETTMTRDDESMSLKQTLSPVVQNEAPVSNPMSFGMETKKDEIAAAVPLPEEPAERSGDQPQG